MPVCTSQLRDDLLELVAPTRCVGCDEPGSLLCDVCRDGLPWIEQRLACPVCGAPFGHLTCTECGVAKEEAEPWESRSAVAALSFEGVARPLVTCYKDAHERRLAPVLAALIATALDEASAWPAPDGAARFDASVLDAVCFVPATNEAYRRRGFDHMELVCRNLCALEALPMADVLARTSAADQRDLGRLDRVVNARGTFHVVDDVSGLNLLLIDDVITTGASVRAATASLLERGAASVAVAAVCRVW